MESKVLKYPVFAAHDADQLTVYQAYNHAIGDAALAAGSLDVPAFSKTRMTWIKPSFLWMMYRCGWGLKDAGQAVVLRLTLKRAVFEGLIAQSCLSSFDAGVYGDHEAWREELEACPNRVQWDPDKDLNLAPMQRRAIQIGIAPAHVPSYLGGILEVSDATPLARQIHELVCQGQTEQAQRLLPKETEMKI